MSECKLYEERKMISAKQIGELIGRIVKLWKPSVTVTTEELIWLNRYRARNPFSQEAWTADLNNGVRLRKRLEAARKSGEIRKVARP
jgi:hypothetical protein